MGNIPCDSILLGDGTFWKVPTYPGGLKQEAVDVRKWFDKLTVKIQTRRDVLLMLAIEREEAGYDPTDSSKGDKEKLQDIARRMAINDKDFNDDLLGEGFEFLAALKRLEGPLSDAEAYALFPGHLLTDQVLRARLICRTGRPLDDVSKEELTRPDPTSTNISPNGTTAESPLLKTVTGG